VQYRFAIDVYERAASIRPELIKPQARLGIIYCDKFEFRNIPLGLTHLFTVLEYNPNHPEAMYAIANCYLKDGDEDQAREWLEKVLAADPSHQAATEQLKRLNDPWR